MNEKHPENPIIEKIVETQEESEQDDEITLRLFADGELHLGQKPYCTVF
jgi:hypothetical protein